MGRSDNLPVDLRVPIDDGAARHLLGLRIPSLVLRSTSCTPQACAFRDHHSELRALGAEVFGLSTQNSAYQQEAVARLQLPFELLSDEKEVSAHRCAATAYV